MSTFQDSVKLSVLLGIGASLSAALAASVYFTQKRRKLQTPPNSWKEVGHIEEIHFFPIKSCAPIVLESVNCTNLGILEQGFVDRALMLVDKTNKMITARTYNHMMKIQPKIISHGKLLLSAPGMEDIELDVCREANKIKADVWGANVSVTTFGEDLDNWFSRFILNKENGLRLAHYPHPVATRPIVEPIFENMITKDTSRIPILLVVLFISSAHAAALANTSSIVKDSQNVAQKLPSSAGDANTIKNTVTKKLSVVQDWSLVCEELCGADLAGPQCASACDDIRKIERKAYSLLGPNRSAVCSDLCSLGFGGSMCDCSAFIKIETIKLENDVCNAFCEHNNITLNGCSKCITDDEEISKGKEGKEVYAAPNAASSPTSTTPDWDALCISLCKKGDGGVLCNCDLPPLL